MAQIILDSLSLLQQQKRIRLYGYVLMKDHLHMIASANNLSKEIGDLKSYTARSIVDYLQGQDAATFLQKLHALKLRHKRESIYQVWQEGSHPELICNEAMMKQKLEYIHYNPVRSGYVTDPLDWEYSSARNYVGLKGLIEVNVERHTMW